MPPRFGDASARAARWVKNQGFSLPDEPGYSIPILPADITQSLDPDLMVLFEQVRAWMDFTEVVKVSAEIDYEQAKLDIEKQERVSLASAQEKTVTAAKAKIFQDEDYLDLRDEVKSYRDKAEMISVVYNSLERKKFIISREISRRTI